MREGARPVADVDKDVAGGVERKAARPEPAGVLNAHAQAPAQLLSALRKDCVLSADSA